MVGADGLYAGSPLVQVSQDEEAADLILGLPILLGSINCTRGSRLLCPDANGTEALGAFHRPSRQPILAAWAAVGSRT